LDAIDSLQPLKRDFSKPLLMPICDVVKSSSQGQVSACGKLEAGALRSGLKVCIKVATSCYNTDFRLSEKQVIWFIIEKSIGWVACIFPNRNPSYQCFLVWAVGFLALSLGFNN
jgi:hypothetical protein